jgi:2-polyprenyl-3-methyl-5-hydroxy-6-metoxy-1,4-benzoquinol methylase
MMELGLLHECLRVLDYGCGVGRIAAALLERYRARIRAVDSSPWMLRHAIQYLGPRVVELNLGSDRALFAESPRSAFDLIVFVEVVQHIPELQLAAILPALGPMLAPGGRIFIYGNEKLDVDRDDRLTTTLVRDAVARELHVVREDFWSLEPQSRFSLVCVPRT